MFLPSCTAQVSRDSVVCVYQSKGEDARFGHKEINAVKKEVTTSTYEQDERSKEGIEYEKSRFMECFKDQPDIIRRAKWKSVRCKKPNGKWVIEQRTRVYALCEGEYRFKETAGAEVRQSTRIDDGSLELCEGQQEKVFDDTAAGLFDCRGGAAGSLTRAEVEKDTKDYERAAGGSVSNTQSKAKVKGEKKDTAASSTSEDELSPLERSLASSSSRTPKKPKKDAKGCPTPSPQGKAAVSRSPASAGGSHGGSEFSDKSVTLILDEVDREFANMQQQNSLENISVETLGSLAARLQTKKQQVGKKASKKGGDAVTMMDELATAKAKTSAVVELLKMIGQFDKKRCRKTGQAVLDKFHSMKGTGAFSLIPTCLSCCALFAQVQILAEDQQFSEAVEFVKFSSILEHSAQASDAEQQAIQKSLVNRLLTEVVRHAAESKESQGAAKGKVTNMCNEIIRLAGESIKPLLLSITCILNDKCHSTREVVEAFSVIDKSKNTELVKVLLNLSPFDAVITAVRERAVQNEKLTVFTDELQGIFDSEKAKELANYTTHDDSNTMLTLALEVIEMYGRAFKGLPSTAAEDMPSTAVLVRWTKCASPCATWQVQALIHLARRCTS